MYSLFEYKLYLQFGSLVKSFPTLQGHKINQRGCEMIIGRGKKKKNLIYEYVSIWIFIIARLSFFMKPHERKMSIH